MPQSVLPNRSGNLHAGVDENGLGPLLGPLLVTGCLARMEDGVGETAFRPLAARVGDSKALVDFHDSALGEAWARALARRDGNDPATFSELLDLLLLEPRDLREARCPSEAAKARCFGDHGPFSSTEAHVKRATDDLARLENAGVRILSFRAESICVKRLNQGNRAGISRFSEDLRGMERVLLDFYARFGGPMNAICGKVGGYEKYARQFHHLSPLKFQTLGESRGESSYHFNAPAEPQHAPPFGTVAFVRDADATAPLVGLASLVGKYLRDRMMRTIGQFHLTDAQAADPSIASPPSGYHDPVTLKFVAASAERRRLRADLPEECFAREGAKKEDKNKGSNSGKSLPLFGTSIASDAVPPAVAPVKPRKRKP